MDIFLGADAEGNLITRPMTATEAEAFAALVTATA